MCNGNVHDQYAEYEKPLQDKKKVNSMQQRMKGGNKPTKTMELGNLNSRTDTKRSLKKSKKNRRHKKKQQRKQDVELRKHKQKMTMQKLRMQKRKQEKSKKRQQKSWRRTVWMRQERQVKDVLDILVSAQRAKRQVTPCTAPCSVLYERRGKSRRHGHRDG